MRRRRFTLLPFLVLALAARLAGGETTAPAFATGRVVQVAVPGAVCAAVSEPLRLLAIAHAAPGEDGRLTLVPLDAQGLPAPGKAWSQTLARPEALKDHAVYATGLAFHPRLPLLYVWRDTAYPNPPPAKFVNRNPAYLEFDRLLVYAVGPSALVQTGAFVRGAGYAYGLSAGGVTLDPAGKRLFLPNLRVGKDGPGIGYLPLTTNGAPLTDAEGALRTGSVDLSGLASFPAGRSWACFSERIVCTGGDRSLIVWDTGNRLGALNRILLLRWSDGPVFAGGHPAVPAVYMANGTTLGMIAAPEGYPSLLPVPVSVPGAAFGAPPVVVTGAPASVAFGSAHAVQLKGIDPATGAFNGRDGVVAVTNPAVRAVAGSDRWNRFYVAVEALP